MNLRRFTISSYFSSMYVVPCRARKTSRIGPYNSIDNSLPLVRHPGVPGIVTAFVVVGATGSPLKVGNDGMALEKKASLPLSI